MAFHVLSFILLSDTFSGFQEKNKKLYLMCILTLKKIHRVEINRLTVFCPL